MRKRVSLAVTVIVFMFSIIGAYTYFSYSRIKPEEGRICEGIKVGDVAIGNMTKEEAEQAVGSYRSRLCARSVEIVIDGQTVSTTVGEIGYSYTAGNFAEAAMKVGRSGNAMQNYKEINEAAKGKIVYPLTPSLDESVLSEFVQKKCKKLCTKAKNSNIKRSDGVFVYTESRNGVTFDMEETIQKIKNAVAAAGEEDTVRIEVNVTVEQPKVTKETAARCKDKIGSFSTTFNAGNVDRSKNLANAARLINGAVVYPGETFSVHDTISPLTEENGYYAAASYNNGKVEDSLGGGVCQVSTTLYNAVLKAELEIVTRSPHSMAVSYVRPSMDAAIAGDYKDFKFKNNGNVPLYIEGGTYGGTIYFNIYGEETRSPDRQVRFESEVTETIEPGADKVTYDKTKPTSYMAVTQEAHTGYKAKLWKIVTENGKETKTLVNTSTYAPSPRYVVRGSKKEEKKPEKPEKDTGNKSNPREDDSEEDDKDSGRRSGVSGEDTSSEGNTPSSQPTAEPAPAVNNAAGADANAAGTAGTPVQAVE